MASTPMSGSGSILLRRLPRYLIWAVAANIVFLAIAILIVRAAEQEYTAAMQVAPATSVDGSGIAFNPLESLGLAGGLSGEEVPPFVQFHQILRSRLVAREVMRRPNLVGRLLEVPYNEESGRFQQPEGFVADAVRSLKSLMALQDGSEPSLDDVEEFLQTQVFLRQIGNTGIHEIVIEHPDREAAGELLELMFETAEDTLRTRERARLTGNVNYLKRRLPTIENISHRTAMTQFLVRQEQMLMALETNDDYSAYRFEDVSISDEPTAPQPARILVLTLLVGNALLALAVALDIRRVRRRHST